MRRSRAVSGARGAIGRMGMVGGSCFWESVTGLQDFQIAANYLLESAPAGSAVGDLVKVLGATQGFLRVVKRESGALCMFYIASKAAAAPATVSKVRAYH